MKNIDFFSIQLDESIDVSNYAQTTMKEEYLLCEVLCIRTLMKCLKNWTFFFENGLNLKQCWLLFWRYSDITGEHGGVASKMKLITENGTLIYSCSIHRVALIVKCITKQFKLQETIKVVNFIKFRVLQSRLLSKQCSQMGN